MRSIQEMGTSRGIMTKREALHERINRVGSLFLSSGNSHLHIHVYFTEPQFETVRLFLWIETYSIKDFTTLEPP